MKIKCKQHCDNRDWSLITVNNRNHSGVDITPKKTKLHDHCFSALRGLKPTPKPAKLGLAIAQALSRRSVTAETRVLARVSGQSGTGTGYSPSSSVLPSMSFHRGSTWWMSKRPVGGSSSEIQSNPIDKNNDNSSSKLDVHALWSAIGIDPKPSPEARRRRFQLSPS
jgi:hypothetical protein